MGHMHDKKERIAMLDIKKEYSLAELYIRLLIVCPLTNHNFFYTIFQIVLYQHQIFEAYTLIFPTDYGIPLGNP